MHKIECIKCKALLKIITHLVNDYNLDLNQALLTGGLMTVASWRAVPA